MLDSMQEQIIDLIPSKSLKKAIRETGYRLSDIALLSTAYICAPDFNSRLEYLLLVRDSLVGEIRSFAERLIQAERQQQSLFFRNDAGAVIELHIKETPDAYEETYLCSSIESAMKMISMYYEEYGGSENTSSRYHFVKRRVFSAAAGQKFSEDSLGEAVFLPGEILYSVDMDGFCVRSNCSHLCFECDGYGIECQSVQYPYFTEDGDAVEYFEDSGKKRFGVVRQWTDAPANECYIIPLDCPEIRYHDFDNATFSHQHIPAPFVEKISPNQLPDEMREDYWALVNYLLSNGQHNRVEPV